MPRNFVFTILRLLIASLVLLPAMVFLSQQTIEPVVLKEQYSYSCKVKNTSGKKHFHIYMPTNWQVEEFAQTLCDTLLAKQSFETVTVSWQPREMLSTEQLLSDNYALFLNRDYALSGLLPNWDDFYTAILSLPSYQISWFSHQDNMQLSANSLKNKRIGLLEDKRSESGYLAPMSELKQFGHGLNNAQLVFYPNRESLVNDFLAEKLDIIPSVGHHGQLKRWPASKTQPLQHVSSTLSWYLNDQYADLAPSLVTYLQQYQSRLLKVHTTHPYSLDKGLR